MFVETWKTGISTSVTRDNLKYISLCSNFYECMNDSIVNCYEKNKSQQHSPTEVEQSLLKFVETQESYCTVTSE